MLVAGIEAEPKVRAAIIEAERQDELQAILADDLGYGDVRCYNDQSKVATPHLDRLAREVSIVVKDSEGTEVRKLVGNTPLLSLQFRVRGEPRTIYAKYEPLNLTGSRGLFAMGKLAMHNTTPGLVAEYKKPGQTEVTFPVGIALFTKGKDGKRGTQASGSGMGLTKTDKQAAVWEWLKFVSNKDNGVEQVFGGAGSPGGRTDVWNDPKLLKERDPIYSTVIKAYPQGAGSPVPKGVASYAGNSEIDSKGNPWMLTQAGPGGVFGYDVANKKPVWWPVENAIHHDQTHPSHLLIPVVPDAPEIQPVGAPIAGIEWPMVPGFWMPDTKGFPLV